jgi:hypothetical protein
MFTPQNFTVGNIYKGLHCVIPTGFIPRFVCHIMHRNRTAGTIAGIVVRTVPRQCVMIMYLALLYEAGYHCNGVIFK